MPTQVNFPSDFKVGQRVELHPCTDEWMMGARFGEVRRINHETGHIWLRMDAPKLRKLRPFHPDNILTSKNRNP